MNQQSRPTLAAAPWSGGAWWRIDVALAVVVAAGQVGGTWAVSHSQHDRITALGVALLAAAAAALVLRSRHPVAVLGVTFAATLWYWSSPYPRGPVFVALIVAFGSCLIASHRIAAWAALAAGYVLFLWLPPLAGTHPGPRPLLALALAAWLLVLAAVFEGLRLARRRAFDHARHQAEEDRRHSSEERLRIARDLHDALAHHISLISVQATTGEHLFDRQPEQARAALTNIKTVARQALGELRSVLDILRQGDQPGPPGPSPSLAHLEDLVTQAHTAGIEVALERAGRIRALPDDVESAAYRIVQEALTNTTRHSAANTARVRVEYGDHNLRLEIDDPGPARHPPDGVETVSRRGLTGMRERVEALGGQIEAGPHSDGRFMVNAELPTRLPPAANGAHSL